MSDDRRILVRRVGSDAAWSSSEISTYDNEGHLQALLVADPTRVPGVTHEASAVAELSTSGGPIDGSIVESDGCLTVVECKLASNSERRRMVIGQVIDYASAIWMDGEESFFRAWQARGGSELTEMLAPDALADLNRNIVEARMNLVPGRGFHRRRSPSARRVPQSSHGGPRPGNCSSAWLRPTRRSGDTDPAHLRWRDRHSKVEGE